MLAACVRVSVELALVTLTTSVVFSPQKPQDCMEKVICWCGV